jgi:hypothetical protein
MRVVVANIIAVIIVVIIAVANPVVVAGVVVVQMKMVVLDLVMTGTTRICPLRTPKNKINQSTVFFILVFFILLG